MLVMGGYQTYIAHEAIKVNNISDFPPKEMYFRTFPNK